MWSMQVKVAAFKSVEQFIAEDTDLKFIVGFYETNVKGGGFR